VPGICIVTTGLPVELVSFDAVSLSAGAVQLTWETVTETNNAGFEIEHKAPGDFTPVDFVEGAGTTVEPQSYSYRVTGLEVNRHIFRLKQIDHDGSVTYGDEVEVDVEVPGSIVVYEAYPNPFTTLTTLRFAVS
jgi:hypothetical protein